MYFWKYGSTSARMTPSSKYFLVFLAVSAAILFVYISQTSLFPVSKVDHSVSPRLHGIFIAKRFRDNDGKLEMQGYFSEAGNQSTDGVVIVEGLSNLLREIKYTPQVKTDTFHPAPTKKTIYNNKLFETDNRMVHAVNCAKIIQGDRKELNRSKEIQIKSPKKQLPPWVYINMTRNCDYFKRHRGYITSSLSKEEENFPIAFSFLMFKDVEQAERLLRAIYRPQNYYCIHYDKKSKDDVKAAMTAIASCFDNVFMASKFVDVRWGEFSVLEPEIVCMEDIWKRSKKWKYFINLTGQEFPIRTNYELVRILMAYNGANDLEGTVKRANRDRWDKAGPPPHNITATKGSVHIVVNRDFVDYVLHNQIAKDFMNWTRHVGVPDETFFSSLNHNPQLGIRGSFQGPPETNWETKPFMTRFKNWGNGYFDWPCEGKRVRLICVFGVGDLPLLTKRHELFANKFYWDYQNFALDCMEEWHFNRTRDGYFHKIDFDTRYYEKLGFVQNKVE